MQIFLEWLHWIRLIFHRHPNGPAWIQGIGSMAAVMVALLIFWRQGKAREQERRDDNRIRQQREEQDDKIRRVREEKDDQIRRRQEDKNQFERRLQERSIARIAANDRETQKKTLLIVVWPVMVQTRSQMAMVLGNLRYSMQVTNSERRSIDQANYVDYLVGVMADWQRIDREIFIFGDSIAVAIHEMLAIIRQNDRDIERQQMFNGPINYRMHSTFLMNAKVYADTSIKLLEEEYIKLLGVKPKRAVFWAPSAKAVASKAEKRKNAGMEVSEP